MKEMGVQSLDLEDPLEKIPLQYSCLENPMDRGAWWATVQGVAKSPTQQHTHTLFKVCKGEVTQSRQCSECVAEFL